MNYRGGYDREIGDWKIIDVHCIPDIFWDSCELDFYCSNGRKVHLLRIRPRSSSDVENYITIHDSMNDITYLIAEIYANKIDNGLIERVLNEFEIE